MIEMIADVRAVYAEHKKTWTENEKQMVHDKLNMHGLGDGRNEWDQALMEISIMFFVDGIRAGRER